MVEFFVRHADASQIMIFAVFVSGLWLIEHIVIAQPEGQKLPSYQNQRDVRDHGATSGAGGEHGVPGDVALGHDA